MVSEFDGITPAELARNIKDIKDQLRNLDLRFTTLTNGFITTTFYQEAHDNLRQEVRNSDIVLSKRLDLLESQSHKRTDQFVTSFLYPTLMIIIGTVIGLVVGPLI